MPVLSVGRRYLLMLPITAGCRAGRSGHKHSHRRVRATDHPWWPEGLAVDRYSRRKAARPVATPERVARRRRWSSTSEARRRSDVARSVPGCAARRCGGCPGRSSAAPTPRIRCVLDHLRRAVAPCETPETYQLNCVRSALLGERRPAFNVRENWWKRGPAGRTSDLPVDGFST